MLLQVSGFARILGLRPVGILHVGAHRAEEFDDYERFGWAPRIWVEALPDLAEDLRRRFENSSEDEVVEGAAWHTGGLPLILNRTSVDASSSLFPLGEHAEVRPDISIVDQVEVTTVSLQDVTDAYRDGHGRFPELLNLDVQGAELAAIRSFGDDVPCDWILTEVSWRPLYQGQPLLDEVDAHLGRLGFIRVALAPVREAGWGDAVYARAEVWRSMPVARRLVFGGWVRAVRSRRDLTVGRVLLHRRLRGVRRRTRAGLRSITPDGVLAARRRLLARIGGTGENA